MSTQPPNDPYASAPQNDPYGSAPQSASYGSASQPDPYGSQGGQYGAAQQNPYGTAPGGVPADYPGKTLGLVGLILAIVAPLVGLILSVVAQKQSKEAGFPNQLAKIGVIVGAILTALGVIGIIIYIIFIAVVVSNTPTY